MVIIPKAFLLSEAATDTPGTHARIGYQSWLRDLEAAAAVASTEEDDFPADAVLREDTAESWSPTALPATITIDLGTSRDIDYFGIVGSIGSAGCAVKCETSVGELDTSDEQIWETFASEVAPADDAPLMFLDDPVIARWVRLTLTGGAIMPRVSVLYAGEVLKMQRAMYRGITPPTLSRQTTLEASLTRGGQFLGQGFRAHGIAGELRWARLTAAWYRANFDPFVKHWRSLPAFIAWRPADYPLECVFAWATGDVQPQNDGPRDLMSVTLPLVGIGHE